MSEKDKVTATRQQQLAYSARQMFEARIAKYNDPKNLECEWADLENANRWERHAFSAYVDLVAVEKERDELATALTEARADERAAAVAETWGKAIEIAREWLAAYPVEVFPEPPPPPAECSRDVVSAAMGRYIATKLIEDFTAARQGVNKRG